MNILAKIWDRLFGQKPTSEAMYRIRATSTVTGSSSLSSETYTLAEATELLADLRSEPMNNVLIFSIEEV